MTIPSIPDAQQAVVAAQHALAAAESDLAKAVSASRPNGMLSDGALIVEFGGKLYAASRPANVGDRTDIAEYAERQVVRGRYFTITCGCGESVETSVPRPATGTSPVVYRYFRQPKGSYLVLARTPHPDPPCEHWHELPLTFRAEP